MTIRQLGATVDRKHYWFLKLAVDWFYGRSVKEPKFYQAISKWPVRSVPVCYRAIFIPKKSVLRKGQSVPVGPRTFYSASTSAIYAIHGLANWHNLSAKELAKFNVAVIKFRSAKVYATNSRLLELMRMARQAGFDKTGGGAETAELMQEVWLLGGQNGEVITIVDAAWADAEYNG